MQKALSISSIRQDMVTYPPIDIHDLRPKTVYYETLTQSNLLSFVYTHLAFVALYLPFSSNHSVREYRDLLKLATLLPSWLSRYVPMYHHHPNPIVDTLLSGPAVSCVTGLCS
jgi:hypothetical protein